LEVKKKKKNQHKGRITLSLNCKIRKKIRKISVLVYCITVIDLKAIPTFLVFSPAGDKTSA
jgi:hypothetical protein